MRLGLLLFRYVLRVNSVYSLGCQGRSAGCSGDCSLCCVVHGTFVRGVNMCIEPMSFGGVGSPFFGAVAACYWMAMVLKRIH